MRTLLLASLLAPALAAALIGAGCQLHQLQPQRRDLETVFAEVNEEAIHG
jgi:ABC-2 type transport system ATP-binding protein